MNEYGQAWRGILFGRTYSELEELISRSKEIDLQTGAKSNDQKEDLDLAQRREPQDALRRADRRRLTLPGSPGSAGTSCRARKRRQAKLREQKQPESIPAPAQKYPNDVQQKAKSLKGWRERRDLNPRPPA